MQKLIIFIFILFSSLSTAKEKGAEYHLKQIERYNDYMRNPKNQKSSMGFIVTGEHPSIDKEEHLEALVKLGTLTKKTYRFEKRKNTRENTKRWMTFASGRKDILEATAEYFEPGTKPLQFTFWYLSSAKDEVDEFVNEMKK